MSLRFITVPFKAEMYQIMCYQEVLGLSLPLPAFGFPSSTCIDIPLDYILPRKERSRSSTQKVVLSGANAEPHKHPWRRRLDKAAAEDAARL